MKRLRVLAANERQDLLAGLAAVVAGLGHEVIAPQIEVSEVGQQGWQNSIEIVLRRFADRTLKT